MPVFKPIDFYVVNFELVSSWVSITRGFHMTSENLNRGFLVAFVWVVFFLYGQRSLKVILCAEIEELQFKDILHSLFFTNLKRLFSIKYDKNSAPIQSYFTLILIIPFKLKSNLNWTHKKIHSLCMLPRTRKRRALERVCNGILYIHVCLGYSVYKEQGESSSEDRGFFSKQKKIQAIIKM